MHVLVVFSGTIDVLPRHRATTLTVTLPWSSRYFLVPQLCHKYRAVLLLDRSGLNSNTTNAPFE